MKNIAILALCSIFLFGVSCKKKQKTGENTEDDSEVVISSSKENESSDALGSEQAKDCDDFIDQYEEWSEEYVAFLSKYKDDPIKAVTSPEYGEMMQKASSWSQQWLSLSVSCAQNSSYEERVTEIADRMDKKVEELGFK
ncbi:MAG: DUF6591 domain-containing protein [Bacteroidota bacterium]